METYHITQEGNRWLLREEGDSRVLIETASREAALEQTRDYLKLRTATVQIHGRDGQLEEERHYPQEQNPRATGG